MDTRSQSYCWWSGIIFMLMYGLGWWILAGFLPPPSPNATGDEIAQFYQADSWRIRLGLVVAAASCMFYFPWISLISIQMKRIEGSMPTLAWTQLATGTLGGFIIMFTALMWLLASFRPDRDPQVLLLINDMGWLIFTTTLAPFLTQNIVIALAIFQDKSAAPVFPRWLGFYNLATTSLFLPAGLIVFFKAGPFAWNGMLAFWIPLIDFFVWMIVMTIYMSKAINQQK